MKALLLFILFTLPATVLADCNITAPVDEIMQCIIDEAAKDVRDSVDLAVPNRQ